MILYISIYIQGPSPSRGKPSRGEGGPLEARLLQLPGPLAKPTVGRYCTAPLALAASWAWESEDDGSENGKHKGFGWFLGCKSGAKATVNYGS